MEASRIKEAKEASRFMESLSSSEWMLTSIADRLSSRQEKNGNGTECAGFRRYEMELLRMNMAVQPSPPVAPETGGSSERYRLMALAAITGGLVVLCVMLALPFLPAISWGLALTIITWPMHRWIARR